MVKIELRPRRQTLIWGDISNAGVDSILGHFAFVGWVEPVPDFAGYRCTPANLHFAGVFAEYETQQWPKIILNILQRLGQDQIFINFGLRRKHDFTKIYSVSGR
jgi:hypothetical protein